MFMDDDSKETNVSTIIANMLLKSDFIDSAKSAPPDKAVAANAELEELEVLFRDYHKLIFRIAYRITGSQSDAEDVLQTIFLRLTSNRARRDLSPNPVGYLHRAAVNASLDLLRNRTRANSVSLDVIDFNQSSKLSTQSPEDDFADSELRELIRHAVARLEGRAATAFALRYFEGYDNGRIAQVLGTSQMVVAVTLHRARTRLRKEIGNYLEKHHEA
jgi:RNA polymerase sigma-70 factor (ECF subfamily)